MTTRPHALRFQVKASSPDGYDHAAQRAKNLSGQTLGQLANLLFASFVVPEGFERELLPEDKTPTDQVYIAREVRMTMQSEQLAQTKLAVRELVDLRNELVHHLLSRFSLCDEQGCIDAIAYLEDSYLRIDARYQELRRWLWVVHKGAEAAVSFMQSETFHDLIVNGINPDGSFEWSDTGIVRALRTQVQALAGYDWVPLETVTAQMLAHHPNQTLQKYRCSSWQQVVHESGEFDLEYRRESDAAAKKPWVRLRPERALRSGAKERKPPGRGPMSPLSDQIVGPG